MHTRPLPLAMLLAAAACAPASSRAPASDSASTVAVAASDRWCDHLPRPTNAALPKAPVESDWFDVRVVAPGIYAFIEGKQWQEAISYLVVGTKSALLFDTGIGAVPIRPLVERLTSLPVRVVNSHTHYDHVGGNHEFSTVMAMDGDYTRHNQEGFAHKELAGEVAPEAMCGAPPAALDTAAFMKRPWKSARAIADGDTLDLGGRTLQVLSVPGHTPDALALFDRADSLLFTGDTYYDAPVWLYVPETDLDAYEKSIARLSALAPQVKHLLPAHNTAIAEPARLAEMVTAIRRVREGKVPGKDDGAGRLLFDFPPHFSILTAKAVLDGSAHSVQSGGSGLTVPQ